jgi:hypothetical protein
MGGKSQRGDNVLLLGRPLLEAGLARDSYFARPLCPLSGKTYEQPEHVVMMLLLLLLLLCFSC